MPERDWQKDWEMCCLLEPQAGVQGAACGNFVEGRVPPMNEKQRKALLAYLESADRETLQSFVLDVITAYQEALMEHDFAPLTICLEEWLETLDIMNQPNAEERLRQAEKDLAEGRGIVRNNNWCCGPKKPSRAGYV